MWFLAAGLVLGGIIATAAWFGTWIGYIGMIAVVFGLILTFYLFMDLAANFWE
jgi:hypothetical protein